MPNPKAQGRGVNASEPIFSKCLLCGRNHIGNCLIGTGACFECGKKGHKISEFPSCHLREEKVILKIKLFQVDNLNKVVANAIIGFMHFMLGNILRSFPMWLRYVVGF